ncbi:MAG: serine protease [Thermodesulfatator sp.]|nr:MAG: serine protease [Thermodesulfatator sp.]
MKINSSTEAKQSLFSLLLSMLFVFPILLPGQVSARTAQEDANIELLSKTSQAIAEIVKEAMPAVVFVQVEKTVEQGPSPFGGQDPFGMFNDPFFQRFFGPHLRQRPRKFKQRGQGSGFIISRDGYILTNNHVVGDADTIRVKLADGRKFKAKVIGKDPQSDVAVIKINATGLPTLPLGNSDSIQVGEWVIAIGNPFGLTQTVTVGVISAKGRSRLGITDYEDYIQTDAAINPGNSGGPLINIHGEAIGINSAIFSRSGGYMGIGFAIPINMAKAVKNQLIKNGKVVRGWLGVVIQEIDEDLAKSFGLKKAEGVLISEVAENSPAKKAGLKSGDIILKMDGHNVVDIGELRNKIALTPPGSKVTFDILREGKHKTVTVTIEEKPGGVSVAMSKHEILKELGLVVQELTPDLAQQFGYHEGQGVLVAEVEPGSLAASVGIQPGQLIEEVNRKKVSTVKEFLKALEKSNKTKRVLFKVRDGDMSRYVALRLP